MTEGQNCWLEKKESKGRSCRPGFLEPEQMPGAEFGEAVKKEEEAEDSGSQESEDR